MNSHTNHIVLCGYDASARLLLDTLRRERDWDDHEVVLFGPGERPAEIPPDFHWVSGDPTKESELGKVRLTHATGVIVVGSGQLLPQQADARTILTVFTIRRWMAGQPETARRKRKLYVVAEVLDSENVEHARAAGASEVIESTLVGYSLVAHAMSMPGTARVLSVIAEARGNSLYVGRVPGDVDLPATFAVLGTRLKDSSGAMLIGVRDAAGQHRINPPDDLPIRGEDHLIYLATDPVLQPI